MDNKQKDLSGKVLSFIKGAPISQGKKERLSDMVKKDGVSPEIMAVIRGLLLDKSESIKSGLDLTKIVKTHLKIAEKGILTNVAIKKTANDRMEEAWSEYDERVNKIEADANRKISKEMEGMEKLEEKEVREKLGKNVD